MASPEELKELNEIWDLVKESFRAAMSESTIDLWFTPLILESYENGTITFVTDSRLKYKIISEKHLDRMQNGFREYLGFDVNISLRYGGPEDVSDMPPPPLPKPGSNTQPYGNEFGPDPNDESQDPIEAVEFGSEMLPFNFKYTFDNFIVGNSNKFAQAACFAVADNPAFLESDPSLANDMRSAYNPLFIHGPSGLGKTHLLHAVVNKIKANIPSAKILYIKGDDFTNQLISHLARNTMNEFKEKYRKCDVLLIDDIQFIAGKASTQEEFFHTFNALYEEHKQIILTSDRPPRDIKPLEDRLVTRFEWGLLADIQPPDMELRVAIIKKKAETVGITIPEDVLEFLAENLRSNIRQIEGAIKKLGAMTFLSGKVINIELAKDCIRDLLGGEEPVSAIVDRIFDAVKRHYNVTREDIMSKNRKKEVAYARHLTVYLIRKLTNMSFPSLGKTLDKDYTTCINSWQLIENKMAENPAFATEVNSLLKEISAK